MHCLDCYSGGRQTPAIGVCRQCGAAACAQHVQLGQQVLTCTKPINRAVTIDPPARRLLCRTCSAAHQAHAACCPQSANTVRTP
ncbi:DUF2180 family protein [Streptomyces sp. NPDC006976]|uniref:DUF2180 family protein n=1 Tax=Streptomyces sp. NPDC006976 TaxID=3154311 RepID=UPI0033F93862